MPAAWAEALLSRLGDTGRRNMPVLTFALNRRRYIHSARKDAAGDQLVFDAALAWRDPIKVPGRESITAAIVEFHIAADEPAGELAVMYYDGPDAPDPPSLTIIARLPRETFDRVLAADLSNCTVHVNLSTSSDTLGLGYGPDPDGRDLVWNVDEATSVRAESFELVVAPLVPDPDADAVARELEALADPAQSPTAALEKKLESLTGHLSTLIWVVVGFGALFLWLR